MTDEAITVGELKDCLAELSDSDKIYLPGNLTFYRIKQRGKNKFYIEVNEILANLSEEFKERNPHIKVAFVSIDNIELDENGVLRGPIDVDVR